MWLTCRAKDDAEGHQHVRNNPGSGSTAPAPETSHDTGEVSCRASSGADVHLEATHLSSQTREVLVLIGEEPEVWLPALNHKEVAGDWAGISTQVS